MRLLPAAATALALLTTPVFALGELNGGWSCTLAGGSEFGQLGFENNSYVFANPRGASGRGSLAYQSGADTPTVVFLDGQLVSEVGALGGWLDASIPSEPSLTLIDALGNRVDCTPR